MKEWKIGSVIIEIVRREIMRERNKINFKNIGFEVFIEYFDGICWSVW